MEYPDYTNEEAAWIVVREGLGYAVQHYTSGDRMADPETRRLWMAAGAALNALEKHLAPFVEEI